MVAAILRWLRARHRSFGLGLAAVLPTVLLAWIFWNELTVPNSWDRDLLRRGELAVNTQLRAHGRPNPVRPDFAFVGIDAATLRLDGVWPDEIDASPALKLMSLGKGDLNWSREIYALLLDRLISAGAKLVIFDMVFPNPGVGDEAFRAALERYRDRVVIGCKFDGTPGDDALRPPTATLVDSADDRRVGFVNYDTDIDGAIRLMLNSTTVAAYNGRTPQPGEPVYRSLDGQAMAQLGRASLIPESGQRQLFRYSITRKSAAYPPHPLWEMFSDATWRSNYQDGAFFKDKVVMVGAAESTLHDVMPSPFGEIPGPDLQLQALAAALGRDYLYLTSIWADFALILGAGGLAWAFGMAVRPPLPRLGVFAAVSAVFLGVLEWLYNHNGLMPLAFTPLLAFNTGGLSGLIGEYAVERAEKARVRGVLDRLVSKDIVRELLADRERYTQLVRGQRRPVTVLFSDVRGFTTLSERAADPAAFIAQLNEYLGEMVEIVFRHQGTLDKFIGDAVMAVWGSMHTDGADTDARQAVAAALEMRTRLAALNARWTTEGKLTLAIGIGVNHGDVIVGGLGSEKSKMEITVMGDAVNTASRLEGLTKEYGLDLLIGESVAQRVSESFRLRTVDLVRVKGKTKPTEVMTVFGPLANTPPASVEEMLADYEDAILLYRRREFAGAVRLLEACSRTDHEDGLVALYLARCREMLAEAPDEHWDGVRHMTSK